MIRIGVQAVSVCGPGLPDWTASQPVLRGADLYRPAPIVLEAPAQLSAAERRRAIPSVKLALGVAAAAVAQSGLDPAHVPAVFASSGADGETIVAVLSALATPGREVSPTRFHNSVHNAPSGYWGIAAQSREAVTSISGYDASFAAGLLEAAVQAMTGCQPILLVAYDLPYPDPLHAARRIDAGFGVAFVLRCEPSPERPDSAIAALHVTVTSGGEPTQCADLGLEALRRGNPAARSLPLLALLASRSAGSIRLDLGRAALMVDVVPC
jgi:Beta-ketoacyl synthase, N-terminal domain